VLAAIGLTGVAWSGCSGKQVTEYVAGFSAQVQVPRDLQTIVIRVDVNGQNQFQLDYPVDNGVARLPKSLGIQQLNAPPGAQVNVQVWGFSVSDGTVEGNSNIALGNKPEVGVDTGARLLRSSRQPYIEGQAIYLPMAISFSCYDTDCSLKSNNPAVVNNPDCSPDDCTCKGGLCVSPTTDPTTLPPYNDALLYGTTNTCFQPFTNNPDDGGAKAPGCMDPLAGVVQDFIGLQPQVIDQNNCIFALPGSKSAAPFGSYVLPGKPNSYTSQLVQINGGPGIQDESNLNVRVVYDGIVSEVLNYEGTCPNPPPSPSTLTSTATAADAGVAAGQGPQEGYCTFSGAPQMFQLAPGLCDELNDLPMNGGPPKHLITDLEATGLCAPKTEFQPICDDGPCPNGQECPYQPTEDDGGVEDGGACAPTNVLQPAPSAIYFLFDTSSGMFEFLHKAPQYIAANFQTPALVLSQTTAALSFTPAQASDCLSPGEYVDAGSQDGSLAFVNAAAPGEPIAIGNALGSRYFGDDASAYPLGDLTTPWYLEAALHGAYDSLTGLPNVSTYNRLAVMVFTDRDFRTNRPDAGLTTDCNLDGGSGHADPIQEAVRALSGNDGGTHPVETYVVYLANAEYPTGAPSFETDEAGTGGNMTALANGLLPEGGYYFPVNANMGAGGLGAAGNAIASLSADVGSCVYNVPAALPPGVKLSFPDYAILDQSVSPPAPRPVKVSYSNEPDASDPANGCKEDDGTNNPLWVYDNQHIRLCQSTCQRLITSVTDFEGLIAKGMEAGVPQVYATPQVTWSLGCGEPIPDASVYETSTAAIPPNAGEDGGGEITVDGGVVADAATRGDASTSEDGGSTLDASIPAPGDGGEPVDAGGAG
jgi:hypothetical protein